jgi:hypothetical protein
LPWGVGAAGLALSGLPQAGNGSDVGGDGCGAAERGDVAQFRYQAGGGCGADAVDGGQQGANLVITKRALDVRVDLAQTSAKHVEIFAGAVNLDATKGPARQSLRPSCRR